MFPAKRVPLFASDVSEAAKRPTFEMLTDAVTNWFALLNAAVKRAVREETTDVATDAREFDTDDADL